VRYLRGQRAAPPKRDRDGVATIARMRWEFDLARDPIAYFGQVRRVEREGRVITLFDYAGSVLTRYELRYAPKKIINDPAREAYELLEEL
jgi:hypothetical protein